MAGLKFSSRTHKERSQLASRSKLGFLEKHKDYTLRARNYNLKQKRLTSLRTKASQRNPDEFYFGMIQGKTKGGVHVTEQRAEKYEGDVLMLLKTQDAKYVTMQRNKETKRIQKMSERLTSGNPSNHIVFTEAENEYIPPSEIELNVSAIALKEKSKLEKELAIAKEREAKLLVAEKELNIQRQLTTKGARQKIGTDSNGLGIYKWKAIRKK